VSIPYGWIAAAVVMVATWGHGWITGANHEQAKAKQLQDAELAAEYKRGQAAGIVRDRIVTEYVDRVQVVEKIGRTITKEVPVYVTAKADAACTVPAGFVRVHDAAAQGVPLSGSAGAADEAPSGIAISTVAATVADNYADCRANAEELRKLQEWVRSASGKE
jgi:hypothetical protein